MKSNHIFKLFVVLLLISVGLTLQAEPPVRMDESYPAVPENSGMQPDNSGKNLPAENTWKSAVESPAADVQETDFIAQADDDRYIGTVKGLKYHVTEDGEVHAVQEVEDRSGWQYGKIHPDLSNWISLDEQLKVIIHLKQKPLQQIAPVVKLQKKQRIEELSRQVRDVFQQNKPKGAFRSRRDEKIALKQMKITPGQRNALKAIHQEIDRELDSMKKEIASRAAAATVAQQQSVISIIHGLNGQVKARSKVFNSIGAVIPASALQQLADLDQVELITPDRVYTLDLDASTEMLDADTWWNAGEDGGAYDAAVIDAGIRDDHVYIKYKSPPASNPRPIYKRNAGYYDSHGTRTAGVILSTHSTYPGVAYGLDALFDAWGDGGDTESQLMSALDWVLDCPDTTQSPEVINTSFSIYAHNDEYGTLERYFDAVVDDLNVMITKSAGNKGTVKLGYPQARNVISVANMDIKDTADTSDDIIRSTSSRGPTDAGRRKPDITAPGNRTYSTDIASTTSFANHGGTSAAAPHVAGAIILLEDGGIHNPMAQKAILLNTAVTWSDNDTLTTYGDDGPVDGDRWDNTFGWGVMDLNHAHFHRNDWFSGSVIARNDNATADDYKLYKGRMFANDKAALVWHRRVVYNGSSAPSSYSSLTDINLRLYDEGNGNSVDSDIVHSGNNVHQVSSDALRNVVIKVYSWSSSIDDAASEPYVLATEENFSATSPPSFVITMSMPTVIYFNTEFTVTANVNNNGGVASHNNQVTLNLPAGFTLVSGSTTQNVGTIHPGFTDEGIWTVRSPGYSGNFIISASNSSSCYLETYTGQGPASIEVGTAGLPNLTDYTPSGWSYPIVPRNTNGATSSSCLITATLPGNTSNAYYNWSWVNDGVVDAGSHRTYVNIDGGFLFSSAAILTAGADRKHVNINSPKVISGGRHTLSYEIDGDDEVAENNESDNYWRRQFVWSPTALSDDFSQTRSAPPTKNAWGTGSGAVWYNNNGYSFLMQQQHPNKWWSAVGVLPSADTANYDMRLWDIGSYTGSGGGFGPGYLEWSYESGDEVEFLILNDNRAGSGAYYAGVINGNNDTVDYRIEEATSTKIFFRPGAQWNGVYTNGATNVLDIYEIYLTAGEYFFYLDQISGTCNLGMSLYDSETITAKKSEFITGAYADDNGDGMDEYFQIEVAADGFYGLAVWKSSSSDYGKSGTYRIAAGPPLLTVLTPNGGETWAVANVKNITWDNFGNRDQSVVVELSRDNGSNWSAISSPTANDGGFLWNVMMPGSSQCLIRVSSVSDPAYTDTSDAAFTIDASGIPAEIDIRQGSTSIPHKTGSYDFGRVNLDWDKTVTFTIYNWGGADLLLNGSPRVEIGGADNGYFVVTQAPSSPVASYDSTTFAITFTPDALRNYSAAVKIANNDSDENPYYFELDGLGGKPHTFYVDDNGPGDPGPYNPFISDPAEDGSKYHPFDRVQEGIDATSDGDTVIVLAGKYGENVDLLGKSITVRSSNPLNPSIVASTIINGRANGPVVTMKSGEDQDCIISGLTLTNGTGADVEFAGITTSAGGGVFCVDSDPVIMYCQIVSNSAELGGGLYLSNSDAAIQNCIIRQNEAIAYHGGGMYMRGSSQPELTYCLVTNNNSLSSGGGIAIQQGASLGITESRICFNKAKSGGGIYVANSPNTRLTNCMLYENSSFGASGSGLYDGGGAMTLWAAPVTCTNCVFYGNTAVVEGGAVQCTYTASGAEYISSIFWGNTARSGANIFIRYRQGSTIAASKLTVSYCDVEDQLASIVVEAGCILNYGPDNFGKDPLFADAAGGDFHLQSKYGRWNESIPAWVYDTSTSACTDAGDPADDWTTELRPNGHRINCGAYGGMAQASMSSNMVGNIADFNVDGSVDTIDLRFFVTSHLVDDQLIPENLDRLNRVNIADFAIFADNWLWSAF